MGGARASGGGAPSLASVNNGNDWELVPHGTNDMIPPGTVIDNAGRRIESTPMPMMKRIERFKMRLQRSLAWGVSEWLRDMAGGPYLVIGQVWRGLSGKA